jgi:EmrB/QacA subfamily drug resistance transporter
MQITLSPPESRQHAPDRQSWAILVLLCAAGVMVAVDLTVVNVALPSIGGALRFATAADLQWVVTIYVLFSGGLQLLGGRAADLVGRRRMFLIGLLVFTAASLASGLAPAPGFLIGSRAAQGLGAAVLAPAALSIITTTYTGAQRAAALGAWGAIGGLGAAAGLLIGGLLTTWLGWRLIFLVNLPIGAVTAALTVRLVPAMRAGITERRGLDVGGAVAIFAGLVLFVYGIEGAATSGWTSAHTLVPLALAAALLTAFGVIERSVRWPLIPPGIWRVRSLVSGVAVMAGATAVMAGVFFLNSLYLQRVVGTTALEAGLAFLPFALAIALAAHIGSRMLPRLGTRLTAAGGLVVAGAGTLLLWRVPAHPTYIADLLPGFLAIGTGLGLVFVAVSVAAMADIREDEAGLASGLTITGHEVGAALGVAMLSAIVTGVAGTAATAVSFAAGYRAGLLAGSIFAAALTVVVLLAVPSVRPAAGTHVRMH